MENSGKILRRSIHSFLQNYHYFTSTPLLFALPFSASILISQASIHGPESLFPQIYNRLRTVFGAAGFPFSELFNILSLKVSQTITSLIITLPFTLTFLLIAKASIFLALNQQKKILFLSPSFSSIISLYKPILHTYICNFFLILSANATSFCILCLGFICIEFLGYNSKNTLLLISASGAVLFSVILANALVICNMALAISGMKGHDGGFIAILKACVMIKERTSMALFLALPCNVALAAIEALFQFRVVRTYHIMDRKLGPYVALEGIFIAYLYSIFIILDTIVSCMFYRSFKTTGSCVIQEEDEKQYLRIEFQDEDYDYCYMENKDFDESPLI